jgi:hypothetical protein
MVLCAIYFGFGLIAGSSFWLIVAIWMSRARRARASAGADFTGWLVTDGWGYPNGKDDVSLAFALGTANESERTQWSNKH